MNSSKLLFAVATILGACGLGDAEPGQDSQEVGEEVGEVAEALTAGEPLALRGPVRLQAGSLLGVLATTASRWVIYQDGLKVYATQPVPDAPRILLTEATVPSVETLVDGDTVMLWPDQAAFSPTVPGRFVVWRPRMTPRVLGTRVVVPTSTAFPPGVAASPDGRHVLFLDNVDAAGARGEVVLESLERPQRMVVASGVDTDYASGTCPPSLGFRAQVAGDRHAQPLAAYCQAGATGATLSTVQGGAPRVLASGLAAPQTVQSRAGLVTALTSSLQPISISRSGATQVLDADPAYLLIPTERGEVLSYSVDAASGSTVLKRLQPGATGASRVVGPLSAVSFAASHLPIGGHSYYTDDMLAPRERGMMIWGNDPVSGSLDLQLVDPRGRSSTSTLGPAATCGPAFEPFSRDGRHALLYCLNAAAGSYSLLTASHDTPAQVISSGATAFQHFGLAGSEILYADNVTATATGVAFDLKLADLQAPAAQTTLIAGAATNFVLTADRRHVVYSREDDPQSAGLYLARVR